VLRSSLARRRLAPRQPLAEVSFNSRHHSLISSKSGLGKLRLNQTTSGCFTRLYKTEQHTASRFHKMCPGRWDRAIAGDLGGALGISHLAVLLIFTGRIASALRSMTRKSILRRLLAGFCALPLSAFLLALSRYSYSARELLACWLIFCSLFALLAVLLLVSVLTWHAGLHLVKWAKAVNTLIRELVACLEDPPQVAISGPRILVADLQPPLDALGAHSSLLIEVWPATQDSVQN